LEIISTTDDGQVSFNPAANDSIDFVDDIGIVSLPDHGSVIINSDGSFTYSHDGDCNVFDSFEYYIENDGGRDTAEVVIDIDCYSIDGAPKFTLSKITIMIIRGEEHGITKICRVEHTTIASTSEMVQIQLLVMCSYGDSWCQPHPL